MQGWMRVDSEAVRTSRQLSNWVRIGTELARSLPAKTSKSAMKPAAKPAGETSLPG